MNFAKLCRLAGILLAAAGLSAGAAAAEDLSAPQWHFRADFPCQSELSSRTVNTAVGPIAITLYICSSDHDAFLVAVSDYPPGMVRPDNTETVYNGIVNGMVSEVHGVLRSVTTFSLPNASGREVLADLPERHGVLKSHVFLVGDRLYQVTCVGEAGTDTGPRCAAFQDSFVLTDAGPTSSTAK